MRSRAFRPFATMLSILLLAVVPAQAGPINFAEVVSVLGGPQNGGQTEQLRLRAVAQTQEPSTPASPGDVTKSQAASTSTVDTDTPPATQPTLVAGADMAPQQQTQGNVDVFEQDNVDGTICDCGEIPAVGGGFPKWPLLFLVGIPFFFIHHHHECEGPQCIQTPPECVGPQCTPPQVPEPATLLLLGSGLVALAAGARRRYARTRTENEVTTEEV